MRVLLSLPLLASLLTAAPAPDLARQGRSPWRLVVAQDTADTQLAASVLQRYVRLATGAELRARVASPGSGPELVLRQDETLPEGAFRLKTEGQRIRVEGRGRGIVFGAYAFVERVLGGRKAFAGHLHLPKANRLPCPQLDVVEAPAFAFRTLPLDTRDPHTGLQDPELLAWHGLDGQNPGRTARWGWFVHTFEKLVPARLLATHPEYFSLVDGKRQASQLCLTNPEVLELVCRNLKAEMDKRPGATHWSVSQNDTFGNCTCSGCAALDARHGGPMGSLLTFVNQVAARFPDKTISTLAYQYSRHAPKDLKPLPNVNIMLCSIECNRSQPLATDPSSASFRKDVEDWAKLTHNILLWDYVVQYSCYPSPFPNLHVLQPNLAWFQSMGLTDMFPQASGRMEHEFMPLRGYLLAKLLWNPKADVGALTREALGLIYGPAAGEVGTLIQEVHDDQKAAGGGLGIYGNPRDHVRTWLTPEKLERHLARLDRAMGLLKPGSPEAFQLRRLRLAFEFADLENRKGQPERLFEPDGQGGLRLRGDIPARLDAWVKEADAVGPVWIEEMGRRLPRHWRDSYLEMVSGTEGSLSLGRPVHLSVAPLKAYAHQGGALLTDGLRGDTVHTAQWLGFQGTDVVATVDLGQVRPLKVVEATFLQKVSPWILLPPFVRFEASPDGQTWTPLAEVKLDHPNAPGLERTHTFRAPVDGAKARHLRLYAPSAGPLPAWHVSSGQPSFLFISEFNAR